MTFGKSMSLLCWGVGGCRSGGGGYIKEYDEMLGQGVFALKKKWGEIIISMDFITGIGDKVENHQLAVPTRTGKDQEGPSCRQMLMDRKLMSSGRAP